MTISDVVMATSADDAQAVDALRDKHAEIVGRLSAGADGLRAAAGSSGPEFDQAYRGVRDFAGEPLVQYLRAADEGIYAPARSVPSLRALAEAAGVIEPVIDEQLRGLAEATQRPQAIAAAEALLVLVRTRLDVEDEVLLPALAGERGVDLAAAAAALPDPIALAPAAEGGGGACGCNCGCGEQDSADVPELDVREVPHAIRHATVFGAFDAVPQGGSMILIAPHDPLPLLQQLSERCGGRLEVAYEQKGPEAWRLRLSRS